jgi:hypothetical protein
MGAVEDKQVEELRRWAHGLATDPRPEVQAAAKAITLLADDLDAARSQLLEERMIRQALEGTAAGDDGTDGAESDDVERDLRARLRAILPPRLSRRP